MNDFIGECRRLVAEGLDDEGLLEYLRRSGQSRMDAIRALVELRGLSLARAKETVHFSRTWADLRESAEEFHEFLQRTIVEDEKDR
jgi:hypothetical protein